MFERNCLASFLPLKSPMISEGAFMVHNPVRSKVVYTGQSTW